MPMKIAASSLCLEEEGENFDSIQSCLHKQTWCENAWYGRQHLHLQTLHDAVSAQNSGIWKNQQTEPER